MHERVENEKKLIKVNSFPFDKVYFGMPQYTGRTMKLNRPLFVTPYKGIASIFAVSRNEKIRSIIRGSGYKNLGYDEWGLPESQLQDYLTELHVQVQGGKDFPEQTFDLSGYVYEIDVSKLKDNIYQHPWMTKDREFLIAYIDEVKFSNIRKVNIKTYVKHYDSKPIKESYQIEGDKMKHDGFEEIRALLTGDEFIEESSKQVKELKAHNKQQNELKNKNDIGRVRNIVKPLLVEGFGRENTKDAYDINNFKNPEVREPNKIYLKMVYRNCKTDDLKFAFKYIDNVLDGKDVITLKNTLCKIVGLNPKHYGANPWKHIKGEEFGIAFMRMSTNDHMLSKAEVGQYRYFHFSKSPNRANTGYRPTHNRPRTQASHPTSRGVIYAKNSAFFFAIKKSAIKTDNDIELYEKIMRAAEGDVKFNMNGTNYGGYLYEYIPRPNDRIYRDTIDTSELQSLQMQLHNHGFFRVFIEVGGNIDIRTRLKEVKVNLKKGEPNTLKFNERFKELNATYDNIDDIDAADQEESKLRKYSKQLEEFYEYNSKMIEKIVNAVESYKSTMDGKKYKQSPIPKKYFIEDLQYLSNEYKDKLHKVTKNMDPREARLFEKNCYAHLKRKLRNVVAAKKELKNVNSSLRMVDQYFKEYVDQQYLDETIERFDVFMEEYQSTGCIPHEEYFQEEYIMESAQDNEYAKIVGDYIKKSGKHYFKYQKGVNKLCDDEHLSIEVESRIFDLARKIIDFNDKGNFNQYKAYYDAFCKLVHHPNNSCIMGKCINSINEGTIDMQMRKETSKPIQLKPGTHLFHTSNNPNLRVMSPSHFKGESNANFITRKGKRKIGNDTYYASPRAYFYIEDFGSRVAKSSGSSKIDGYDSKGMPVIKDSNKLPGHLYMYVVKPGDRIYKDPELCGDAVFMSVKKPIKLIKIY